MKLILHIRDGSDGMLALRAARHLIDHPDKADALLEYSGLDGRVMGTVWVKRGKASLIAHEQPTTTPEDQA